MKKQLAVITYKTCSVDTATLDADVSKNKLFIEMGNDEIIFDFMQVQNFMSQVMSDYLRDLNKERVGKLHERDNNDN